MSRVLMTASLLLSASLLACGGKHKGEYEVAATDAAAAAPTPMEVADGLWAQRGDVAKLKEALTAYEQVAAAEPTNRLALERLTRGYYFLGDGHLTETDDKLAAWDTSINWGKRCLALNAAFKAAIDAGEGEDVAAIHFTKEDVPCAYWMSAALGKWSRVQGLGKVLKNIPIVKAWMTQIETLDEQYFYGGAWRYWGAYYAGLPSFAGQDLDKSKEYFEKVIAAHPGHFGNRVLYAENWAVKTQDLKTFEDQLSMVLAGDVSAIPDLQPEQEAEQRKAQMLMAQKGDLFLQ